MTNKYRRYLGNEYDREIVHDRACAECGYNLRGLKFGGMCPECSALIREFHWLDDSFTNLPLDVILRFRISCWLATISVVLFGAAIVVPSIQHIFSSQSSVDPNLLASIVLLALSAWAVAVWLLTTPLEQASARRHGLGSQSLLRICARWSQVSWLVTGVLYMSDVVWGLPGALVYVLGCSFLVSAIALIVFLVFLNGIADWICDTVAQRAFALAIWGLPLALIGLLLPMFLSIGLVAAVLVLLSLVSLLLFISSLLAVPFGLSSLSRSIDWAVTHVHERKAREARLTRRSEDSERIVTPSKPVAPPPDTMALADPDPEHQPEISYFDRRDQQPEQSP